MTNLTSKYAIRMAATAAVASILAGLAMAASVITEPGDLDVRGHGPESDALINHYALENSVSFQIRFIRGVCSNNSNVCIGGTDDGLPCTSTPECASGPLNFVSGETEMFDEDGNSLGVFPFNDVEFEKGAALQNVGICAADSTVTCRDPGGNDEDSCGAGDPTCDTRPSPGYVPDHANYAATSWSCARPSRSIGSRRGRPTSTRWNPRTSSVSSFATARHTSTSPTTAE
jgi:hypothetical protein